MKISELLPLSQLQAAATIPVAIAGENRSITLGQIIAAVNSSIVMFDEILPDTMARNYATGSTLKPTVIMWDPQTKKFYAGLYNDTIENHVILYTEFARKGEFYTEDQVRQDCLYITPDGRLYAYNGSDLISAGLTNEQANLLQLLTPKAIASESVLEAMELAGEIVPGQIYYIPEEEE